MANAVFSVIFTMILIPDSLSRLAKSAIDALISDHNENAFLKYLFGNINHNDTYSTLYRHYIR
ncbi:hypothetical protein TUM4249_23350 [Shewanella sp. KT0246]|nr:hypothetical protein TUM4249_23350 [Shewanella sp. KT0246]